MSHFSVRSRRANTKIDSAPTTASPDTPCEPKTKDWNAEHAVFLLEYNDLIETEGMALEEFRLF